MVAGFSGASQAEPSKVMTDMITTPASEFDVFMTRILVLYGCGGLKLTPKDPCVFDVDYSFSDNVITMSFRTSLSNHDVSNKFYEAKSDSDKEGILKGVLDSVVKMSGVTAKTAGEKYFSVLYGTPIRLGWREAEVDDTEWRSEIAKRTKIEVIISTSQKSYLDKRYVAIRSHQGDVSINPLSTEHYMKK